MKAGVQGRIYRRNNCKLMKTREDPHTIQPKQDIFIPQTIMVPKEQSTSSPLSTKPKPIQQSEATDKQNPVLPVPATNQQKTRSGRAVVKPMYLSDYAV